MFLTKQFYYSTPTPFIRPNVNRQKGPVNHTHDPLFHKVPLGHTVSCVAHTLMEATLVVLRVSETLSHNIF